MIESLIKIGLLIVIDASAAAAAAAIMNERSMPVTADLKLNFGQSFCFLRDKE